MRPLSVESVCGIVGGKLLHGKKDWLIRYGAYRLKQVKHPQTLLFLKGRIIDWKRFNSFFPIAIVTDRKVRANEIVEGVTIIQVKNVDDAYWKFVNYYRDSIDIPVIAVTGTSGKTTTKEMIRHLLTSDHMIASTRSTSNSRTAHLTYLLSMDDSTDAAVFETAVGAPGDITNAAAYFKPTIGIITNIGEHHLDYCKTIEGYIAAKGEMCKVLEPDGVLIVNVDDYNTQTLGMANFPGTLVTFGIYTPCDYRAIDISYSSGGMSMTVNYKNEKQRMYVPGLGVHQVYNALAAIAAVHQLNISLGEIALRLHSFRPMEMQLQLFEGINGCTVIDDTWSITTTSLEAAVNVLQDIGAGRKKIAIIGTITDLGSWGNVIHDRAGEIIANSAIDVLITMGQHAKGMGESALKHNPFMEVHMFTHPLPAYQLLTQLLHEDTLVLIKGDMYSETIKKLSILLKRNRDGKEVRD
ncbi:UDP-N-acetylmuramoyl-tripeptide--D-alanyl-D-alanine ligase [Sporosarcina sp. PTS2304]|uniref:Mur ligase family protein n=1 Tax=Sporosarcina sp. PTS2304 TaxID=2283194 RepID=UPI000E0CE34A|nr:Mur ligase family protein [Sporosarcina sp. PTS2304]AXI00018.1 UDP-N-acetylmuramoyl-tripeptide--D-alanyl-D-alanine ligase [Sporosarcina sp. PTS2304]